MVCVSTFPRKHIERSEYADERTQAMAEMNKLSQAVEENKKRLEQAEASLKDPQHQLAQAQQRKRRP
jgi:hypothetical protein